jgi:type IV pilus assembly protein PilX
MSSIHRNLNYPDNQRGWVLVVGLVILVMLTILSMALMKTTRLEEKMAGATRDMNLSFQAAETALRAAETFIESKTDPASDFGPSADEHENLFTLAWTDTNSKEIDWTLQGVTSKPRYMIKKLEKIGCTPTVFRITVRGTGGTNNRATLLRSHYAKVFGADSVASNLKGPAGCNEGIKLWLDANERYLFSNSDCTTPTLDSEDNVICWKDRSGNVAHVKQTKVHKSDPCCVEDPGNVTHGVPQYQRNDSTLNGKPYVLFKKWEKDALAHNLPTSWEGAHSLFLVVQLHSTLMKRYESYFSNGLISDNAESQFQVGCVTRRCKHNRGWIGYSQEGSTLKFAKFPHRTNQTRIYTIRNDYNGSSYEGETTTYIGGEDTGRLDTANLQKFTRYLIGLNRDATKWTNFRLAELVLYDRALDNCELRDIHEYLATKYGISSEAEGCPAGRLSWEQLFPSQ